MKGSAKFLKDLCWVAWGVVEALWISQVSREDLRDWEKDELQRVRAEVT